MYIRVADWLKAIVFALTLVLFYILAQTISHTVLVFSLAIFIVIIIQPIIAFLEKRGAKRWLAIALTYIVLLTAAGTLIVLAGPAIAHQIRSFAMILPEYLASLRAITDRVVNALREISPTGQLSFDSGSVINQLIAIASAQTRNVVSLIPSIINILTDLFLVFFISLYILLYLPVIDASAQRRLPEDLKNVYLRFFSSLRAALNRYFLGLLAAMFAVGILSGIGVWAVGLPFPVVFGLWAGLTEIIPIVGPILGAIPAIIVALTIKPVLALYVVIVFIAVQQIENLFISPFILGGTIGLNPLVVIFGIIAGGEIAGIVGIFLAVPVLVILTDVMKFLAQNFIYERVEDGPDRLTVRE